MRKKVDELNIPYDHSPVQGNVTVSMGVAAMVPKRDIPEKTIVDMADKSLYQAKETGRNRVKLAFRTQPELSGKY